MVQNIEREKWESVNDLMVEDTWVIDNSWFHKYSDCPSEYVYELSRYKFASKIFSKEGHIFEYGLSSGMAVSVLSQEATSYSATSSNASLIDYLKSNLSDEKYHFYLTENNSVDDVPGKFNSFLLMNSQTKEYIPFIDWALERSEAFSKILLGFDFKILKLEEYQKVKEKLVNKYGLVVPFFFNRELMQCGESHNADYGFLLGCLN